MQKISEVEVTIAGRRLPLRRVQLICEDPSLTKQAFTKYQDIRYIIDQYTKTGIGLNHNPKPMYGDFTKANSEGYLESLNVVANVNSQFEQLTPKIRERFNNKAINFLDFMADPANNEESIKLGLRPKPEETIVSPQLIPPAKPVVEPPAPK